MCALVTRELTPWLWKPASDLALIVTISLVCLSESYSAMPESGATFLHKMVEITQFFDGLHLLIQEMNLDEVTQIGGVEFSEPFHQQNLYFYSLNSLRLLGILVIGKIWQSCVS